MSSGAKPGRPLGVTLAILASAFLFSLVPLARVGFIYLVNRQVYFDPENPDVIGGANVLGVAEDSLPLQVILGVLFLVVAFLAWRGRPAAVRFVLVGFILALMAVTLVSSILPALTTEPCQQLPCDSSAILKRDLARVQLPATLLVPLYVLWYMNRGPARAFYRGYYLPDPADQTDSKP